MIRRSHSWLSYGAQKIRETITTKLLQRTLRRISKDSNEVRVQNPCGFLGYTETLSYEDFTVHMVGTGESQQCVRLLRQVLWPEGCEQGPCPIENIEHPPVGGLYYGMVGT